MFLTHFYMILNVSECFGKCLFAKSLIIKQYSFFIEVCISEGHSPLTAKIALRRGFPNGTNEIHPSPCPNSMCIRDAQDFLLYR